MDVLKNGACTILCLMLPLASVQAGTTVLSKAVKSGERFEVRLPANPSTGYSWMLRTLPAALMLVSSDYDQSSACTHGVTGCGGERVFIFKGMSKGSGKVELVHGRVWEDTFADTQILNVVVK